MKVTREIEAERVAKQRKIEAAQKEQAEEQEKREQERFELESLAEDAGVKVPEPEPELPTIDYDDQLADLKASKLKSLRKEWTFSIIDKDNIPRQYLIPDEKAIKAAVKGGQREIAGIKIYEKESITLR